MPYCLAPPVDIRMDEVSHEDQGLQTWGFFQLSKEGLIYFFLLIRRNNFTNVVLHHLFSLRWCVGEMALVVVVGDKTLSVICFWTNITELTPYPSQGRAPWTISALVTHKWHLFLFSSVCSLFMYSKYFFLNHRRIALPFNIVFFNFLYVGYLKVTVYFIRRSLKFILLVNKK